MFEKKDFTLTDKVNKILEKKFLNKLLVRK